MTDAACSIIVDRLNEEEYTYTAWIEGPARAGISAYFRSANFHYKKLGLKIETSSSISGGIFKREHVDFRLEGPRKLIAELMNDINRQRACKDAWRKLA